MSAPKKIAVAGATGRVGRHLVDILEAEGHEVAAISRSQGVDVITTDGLAEALAGAEVIVDAARDAARVGSDRDVDDVLAGEGRLRRVAHPRRARQHHVAR